MAIVLYSSNRQILGVNEPVPRALEIKNAVSQLLRSRGDVEIADIHSRLSFALRGATDQLLHDVYVLLADESLAEYENIRKKMEGEAFPRAVNRLAHAYRELGYRLEVIQVDLDVRSVSRPTHSILFPARIKKLVYHYIGVEGGYLGDFSYAKHADFYTELGLDIDPYKEDGTTRQRFEAILERSDPHTQAKIIRGILDRYPVDSSASRTQKLHDEIVGWVSELRSGQGVVRPDLQVTSEVVHRALSDADHLLLQPGGATSAVDRAHTALHGYLRELCKGAGISYGQEDSLGSLLKSIRTQHPAFANLGPRPEDIAQILNSFAGVLAVLNPIRNQASVAHANEALLPKAEAMLVINAVRTIMHFLEAKTTSEARARENGGNRVGPVS
jgi:Abortive infection C-terminus